MRSIEMRPAPCSTFISSIAFVLSGFVPHGTSARLALELLCMVNSAREIAAHLFCFLCFYLALLLLVLFLYDCLYVRRRHMCIHVRMCVCSHVLMRRCACSRGNYCLFSAIALYTVIYVVCSHPDALMLINRSFLQIAAVVTYVHLSLTICRLT